MKLTSTKKGVTVESRYDRQHYKVENTVAKVLGCVVMFIIEKIKRRLV